MSDKDNPEEYEKKVPDSGIFVIKGMQINIPEFSMLLAPEGWFEADQIIIHTGLDLCPFWLEIAFEHLLRTEKANDSLLNAKETQNSGQIANALQEEFTAGMQTIMASAVAMDAYYANVKERIEISKELIKAWRDHGTARYKQMAEVLRIAFPMTEESAKQIRTILKQNTGFRDKAVHPPAGTTAPVLHPELNKVTDWRFATFRYYNAKAVARLTLSIIAQTASHPNKEKYATLRTYCETLMSNVMPLLKRWEERYGKL